MDEGFDSNSSQSYHAYYSRHMIRFLRAFARYLTCSIVKECQLVIKKELS